MTYPDQEEQKNPGSNSKPMDECSTVPIGSEKMVDNDLELEPVHSVALSSRPMSVYNHSGKKDGCRTKRSVTMVDQTYLT